VDDALIIDQWYEHPRLRFTADAGHPQRRLFRPLVARDLL
jgi:hypothetical protein